MFIKRNALGIVTAAAAATLSVLFFLELPKTNAINAINAAAAAPEPIQVRRDGPAVAAPAEAVETFEMLTQAGAGPNASCYALPSGEVHASGAWVIGDDNEPRDLRVEPAFLDRACFFAAIQMKREDADRTRG